MARFTAPDGTGLHYDDDGGRGTPILCLSGLTRTGQDFDYAAPTLARHRLIRMDYRGRGRSDRADPMTYTPQTEAQDALALLDHLGVPAAAILGISRGGLIAMGLAATAKDRLLGACLVDVGPELAPEGLSAIMGYLGRPPQATTFAAAVDARAALIPGFENVPRERWEAETRKAYEPTPEGFALTYDPRLRDAVEAAGAQPAPDLWPLFDALADLPLALIRGANSDLLTEATRDAMVDRAPDMILADVPDRGHHPFLDEPAAVAALRTWSERLP